MGKGITYSGNTVDTSSLFKPQEKIQFLCNDPNFLEKAAAKKPNIVWSFVKGAYSHPRDWWVGIFWCMMRIGIFGDDAQSNAKSWQRDLETILTFGRNNPKLTLRMAGIFLKHKAVDPSTYGRLVVGSWFTNFATTGGRFGGKILPKNAKLGIKGANFILASTGAAVLSVKNGGKDIISVLDAIATGDYSPDISAEAYKELFRSVLETDIPIPQWEEDILVDLLDGVLDCLKNPEKYLGEQEKGQATHLPVGTISSARLPGQFGSIPVGSETNMLDYLSETGQAK